MPTPRQLVIFSFIETELNELSSLLADSRSNEYGRVDKVAAWALLSRLYLNAPVYIGSDMSSQVIANAEKVISSSYSLNTSDGNGNGSAYDELFLADNNTNGAQKLAQIAAAVVLCGELSLMAALTNTNELTQSHKRIERKQS